MNKYQKSYQRLTNRIYKYDHIEDVYKDLEILGELVEKATPKKPIKKREDFWRSISWFYTCPTCGQMTAPLFERCDKCDQRLDWSEEEENCDEE